MLLKYCWKLIWTLLPGNTYCIIIRQHWKAVKCLKCLSKYFKQNVIKWLLQILHQSYRQVILMLLTLWILGNYWLSFIANTIILITVCEFIPYMCKDQRILRYYCLHLITCLVIWHMHYNIHMGYTTLLYLIDFRVYR